MYTLTFTMSAIVASAAARMRSHVPERLRRLRADAAFDEAGEVVVDAEHPGNVDRVARDRRVREHRQLRHVGRDDPRPAHGPLSVKRMKTSSTRAFLREKRSTWNCVSTGRWW